MASEIPMTKKQSSRNCPNPKCSPPIRMEIVIRSTDGRVVLRCWNCHHTEDATDQQMSEAGAPRLPGF
jgi:hypothetical protein